MPSLSSSSAFDKRIKTMLICDALTLVGLPPFDKSEFLKLEQYQRGLQPFRQSLSFEGLERLSGNENLS
jgi:hypothetical protein